MRQSADASGLRTERVRYERVRYVSTRGQIDPVGFTEALVGGLASDGGLMVPESLPTLPPDWSNWSYQQAMVGSLELFGAHDVDDLVALAAGRFNHSDIAPIFASVIG